jgi:Cu+-exporting ATPase
VTEAAYTASDRVKYVIVATAVILAFFTAYGYAVSRNTPPGQASEVQASFSSACAGSSGSSGCAVPGSGKNAAADSGSCTGCGTTPADAPEGAAVVDGAVQRVSVDVSKGYFDPTVIRASAGLPIEITFSEGFGCLAEVRFDDFDIREDLTRGGAVVKLPALETGEYGFACGMDMVFGSIVVE